MEEVQWPTLDFTFAAVRIGLKRQGFWIFMMNRHFQKRAGQNLNRFKKNIKNYRWLDFNFFAHFLTDFLVEYVVTGISYFFC